MRITGTYLGVTAVAALALLAGASAGIPSRSDAQDQGRTIDLVMESARNVASIDYRHRSRAAGRLCARGPVCLGDTFIATGVPLRDAATNRRAGRGDLLETVLSARAEAWTITARLTDGSLQVSGQRRHPQPVSDLPVVGGTGAYAGARGTMSMEEIGETGRARLRFALSP